MKSFQFLKRFRAAQRKAYRCQCVVTMHIDGVVWFVYPLGHVQNIFQAVK